MTFAVIHTGGKQYQVKEGDTLKIEKLLAADGDAVTFDKVLLVDDGKTTKIGAPYVAGAKVSAKVVQQMRDKKKLVVKYLQKSRYFKKNGHRQPFFQVKITSIKSRNSWKAYLLS